MKFNHTIGILILLFTTLVAAYDDNDSMSVVPAQPLNITYGEFIRCLETAEFPNDSFMDSLFSRDIKYSSSLVDKRIETALDFPIEFVVSLNESWGVKTVYVKEIFYDDSAFILPGDKLKLLTELMKRCPFWTTRIEAEEAEWERQEAERLRQEELFWEEQDRLRQEQMANEEAERQRRKKERELAEAERQKRIEEERRQRQLEQERKDKAAREYMEKKDREWAAELERARKLEEERKAAREQRLAEQEEQRLARQELQRQQDEERMLKEVEERKAQEEVQDQEESHLAETPTIPNEVVEQMEKVFDKLDDFLK